MKEKTFTVPCGEWIYPCKESSCGVHYSIDETLVVEIFPHEGESGKQVSDSRIISNHLTGPRFLEVSINSCGDFLRISALKNSAEELFEKLLVIQIEFKKEDLDRRDEIFCYATEGDPFARNTNISEVNWNAILFTSILLQAYQKGLELPESIVFRKATIPEIESIGRW